MSTETFRDRTRATRYQPKHQLPPNFAAVLKEYTREVLREQPGDIVGWSAQYFKKLALETDPRLAKQPPPEHYAPSVENPELEVVAMNMSKVFATMDDGNTGTLYVQLVKRGLLEALQLTRAQALYILSSDFVHISDDGTMEYRQFARDSVNAVLFFQQSNHAFRETPDANATIHGMTRDELSEQLSRVLRSVDTEGLGRLPFVKYRQALSQAPVQLTHRDIQLLSAEAEQTSDGFVEFKDEVANAFNLLYLSQGFTSFDQQAA